MSTSKQIKSPSLLIRADAGGLLGTGHVMRMIAVAQNFNRLGGKAVIAMASCPDGLLERLNGIGISHKLLQTDDYGSTTDREETLSLANEIGADWIVLDGYHFSAEFQEYLTDAGKRVLCVDDFGHCEYWNCHALLNQNLGSETWGERKSKQKNFVPLLGADYTLLRQEFIEYQPVFSDKEKPLKRLLVTLGGVDQDNVTGAILELLEKVEANSLQIRVLVGAGNPHIDFLRKSKTRHDLEIMINANNMPQQFEWADGVISAGGSTCWEWLYFGLPGAVVTIADNQVPVVNALKEKKLALDLGWANHFSTNLDLEKQLSQWINNPSQVVDLTAVRKVIDGQGAVRVAQFLNYGVTFRPANSEDAELYFDWVNESAVRANAIDSKGISWDEHVNWFTRKITDEDAVLLLAFRGEEPVGQVRFERREGEIWEVGISVDASCRGLGVGLGMLLGALKLFQSNFPCARVKARILESNEPSIRLFKQCEFQQVSSESAGYQVYMLEPK